MASDLSGNLSRYSCCGCHIWLTLRHASRLGPLAKLLI